MPKGHQDAGQLNIIRKGNFNVVYNYSNDTLFVGASHGLFISVNGGSTWKLFGFPRNTITAIYSPSKDNLLVCAGEAGLLIM